MKTNKILVLLLALTMVLAMIPAFAANGYEVGTEWQVNAPENTDGCTWSEAPDFKLTKEHPLWTVLDKDGNSQNRDYFGLVEGDCETAETQVWGWNCKTCTDGHQKHKIVAVQPAAGSAHDWRKVIVKSDVEHADATCTKDGVYTYYLDCEKCAAITGTTTEPTKAYGHDALIDWAYNYCGVVKSTTISNQDAIDLEWAIHTYAKYNNGANIANKSAALAYNISEMDALYTRPTCYADGKLEITCAECDKVVFTATVPTTVQHVFADENGNWNEVPGTFVVPTCTENGFVTVKCMNAGCTFTKDEVLQAPGHQYSYRVMHNGELVEDLAWNNETKAVEWAVDNIPGCEAYTIVKFCGSVESIVDDEKSYTVNWCNDTQIVKEVAPRWNHEDVTVENYENLMAAGQFEKFAESTGNCTNEAYIVVKCAGAQNTECDFVKKLVLRKAGHVWDAIENGTVKTEATCTSEGEMIVKCLNYDNCKATTIMPIEKKDHVPYETLQDATNCTTEGKITVKCNVCETLIEEVTIPAGHLILNATRDNCRRVDGKLLIIDCTKVATEKGTCERCHLANQTNTYEAKAAHVKAAELVKGENWEETRKATCQQTGINTFDCAACTKSFEEIVPVTEHFADADALVDLVTLQAATCEVEGVKLVKCSATCSETKEMPIAKADHTFEYKNNKLVCAVCGETEDMVDGHDYKVDTKNVNMTSTSTSGNGKVTTKDGSLIANHTKLYARINFGYKLDNGEAVAYVTCVPVENGSFRMASPTAPYGATLTNVTVMITTAENAQDMLIADVPNCGVTVLR